MSSASGHQLGRARACSSTPSNPIPRSSSLSCRVFGKGCLCVNPGQLSKGTGGGTYAELAVHPMPREMLAKKQEGERAPCPLRSTSRFEQGGEPSYTPKLGTCVFFFFGSSKDRTRWFCGEKNWSIIQVASCFCFFVLHPSGVFCIVLQVFYVICILQKYVRGAIRDRAVKYYSRMFLDCEAPFYT